MPKRTYLGRKKSPMRGMGLPVYGWKGNLGSGRASKKSGRTGGRYRKR